MSRIRRVFVALAFFATALLLALPYLYYALAILPADERYRRTWAGAGIHLAARDDASLEARILADEREKALQAGNAVEADRLKERETDALGREKDARARVSASGWDEAMRAKNFARIITFVLMLAGMIGGTLCLVVCLTFVRIPSLQRAVAVGAITGVAVGIISTAPWTVILESTKTYPYFGFPALTGIWGALAGLVCGLPTRKRPTVG